MLLSLATANGTGVLGVPEPVGVGEDPGNVAERIGDGVRNVGKLSRGIGIGRATMDGLRRARLSAVVTNGILSGGIVTSRGGMGR